ncbi:MAG: AMP-binding protein [Verrucomicrobia bacterium]|jgi:acyl-[acyl-carrier-protein]-phospholipid O-acyltransferase/long-chain-fatty-acid--[acyl-carrier-protein] ligase|nr:AMP-binding protein [Verrucomicrobiota bacterium]
MKEQAAAKEDQYTLDREYDRFSRQPELNRHLAVLSFEGLARSPFRKVVVDLAQERKELTGGMVLAVALTLAERWRDTIPGKRVGVVFPSGLGSILTNLALTFLDKVPVNFNFTAGATSIRKTMEMGGVETVITAAPVKEKVPDFPWPEHTVDLVQERTHIDKKQVLKRLALIALLPRKMLLRRFRIPTEGGDREAGLLFSSGSTGDAKGVPLTHRNIIANCLQIKECHLLDRDQILLACLPTFHSFGFTVTLWYPLMTGLKCVTLPSPLETRKIAEAIERERVTVMMGTPTFLRPYFKRCRPEQLASLSFVVGGAEKTPPGFAERWQQTFGSLYLEGYGLTETSPVVSVNLPAFKDQPSQIRTGSVGKLMPGMKARVSEPSSGRMLPVDTQGILELQGANVFNGYLDNKVATQRAFRDGWFVTGDLARIDKDGFVFIEGRISRFSKLGGEMVPHGKVEQEISQAFQLDDAELPLVAVTGVSDDVKGEALVVLAAVEIRPAQLRERLLERGIPNLWIPRSVYRVNEIPCLASGKLDLKSLNDLAARKFREAGG